MNADEGFCGQQVTLTTAIRGVLEDYDGAQVLLELLQNADDAGATHVHFMVDLRVHAGSNLLAPAMMAAQGPAIMVFNNARFSDEDLAAIQRVGAGSKRNDPSTTGKFGLGFCSVYHITDLPCFVTGDKAVFFDPHKRYCYEGEAAQPGRYITFTNNDVRQRYADQIAPFEGVCGFSSKKPFDGTIFRLPMRTPVMAKTSELRPNHPFTLDLCEEIFNKLVVQGSESLLFLKHVRGYSISRWDSGAAEPVQQGGVLVLDPRVTVPLFANHDAIAGSHGTKLSRYTPPHHRCELEKFVAEKLASATSREAAFSDLLCKNKPESFPSSRSDIFIGVYAPKGSGSSLRLEHWRVCTGVGAGQAWQIAVENLEDCLIPTASVAVLAATGEMPHGTSCMLSDIHWSGAAPVVGRAFCSLPLPFNTGLPVHVNARFALSRSRRGLVTGKGAMEKRHLVKFNQALLTVALPQLYAQALHGIVDIINTSARKHFPKAKHPTMHYERLNDLVQAYFRLWPRPDAIEESFFTQLCEQVLIMIATSRSWQLFPVITPAPCVSIPKMPTPLAALQWVNAQSGKFFDAEVMSGDLVAAISNKLQRHDIDVNIASVLRRAIDSCSPTLLDRMACIVRRAGFSNLITNVPKWLPPALAEKAEAKAMSFAPQDVVEFFITSYSPETHCGPFQLGDQPMSFFDDADDVISVLRIVLLDILLREGGDTGPFYDKVSAMPLLLLASNHLTYYAKDGAGQPPRVTIAAEQDLFHLMSSASSMAVHPILLNAVPELYTIEDCRRRLGLALLDVETLTNKGLLGKLLPPEWKDQIRVKWTAGANGQPDTLWIEKVWQVLRTPCGQAGILTGITRRPSHGKELQSMEQLTVEQTHELQRWPLLPVASGALVSISMASTVFALPVSGMSASMERVSKIMKSLGCEFLETSVVSLLDLPTWLKISPLSPEAAVDALATLFQHHGKRPFIELGAEGRAETRRFVAHGAHTYTEEQCQRVRFLPIFDCGVTCAGSGAGSDDNGECVVLGNEDWRCMPATASGEDALEYNDLTLLSSLRLLPADPSLTTLYQTIGVKPLDRVEFITEHLLPALSRSDLQDRTRQALMDVLLRNWTAAAPTTFARRIPSGSDLAATATTNPNPLWKETIVKLRATPLLTGPDGKLHVVSSFVDPSVALLMTIRPGWNPPKPYGHDNWRVLLKDAGLTDKVDTATIINLVTEIAEEGARLPPTLKGAELSSRYATRSSIFLPSKAVAPVATPADDLVTRASHLVRYIYENWTDLDDVGTEFDIGLNTPDSNFWDTIGDIPFVPAAAAVPKDLMPMFQNVGERALGFEPRALVAFHHATDSYNSNCWTQLPYLHAQVSPPYQLMRRLKLRLPTASDAARHLLSITSAYHNVGQQTRTEEEKEDLETRMDWEVRACCSLLEAELTLGQSVGKKQRADACRAIIDALLSRQDAPPWIWIPTEHGSSSTSRTGRLSIASRARAQSSATGNSPTFVHPSRVFFEVEVAVPPFVYRAPQWMVRSCSLLLQAAGVKDTPEPASAAGFISEIASESNGQPLSDTRLKQVLGLARIIDHSVSAVSDELFVMLPSAHSILTSATLLVIGDAPWLDDRILPDALTLLHPLVGPAMARRFGVIAMSTAVDEHVDPNFNAPPCPQYEKLTKRWVNNMRSPQFADGFRRLLAHEALNDNNGGGGGNAGSGGETGDDDDDASESAALLHQRISMLDRLSIQTVKELRTRFIRKSDGADITSPNGGSGSLSVCDSESASIMLVSPFSSNMLLGALATELNRFLAKKLLNLQPLCAMLDAENPDSIAPTLNMMRITRGDDQGDGDGSMSALTPDEVTRVRTFEGRPAPRPGARVAVVAASEQPDGSVAMTHGEVRCRLGADDFVVVTAGSGSAGTSVPLTQLRYILSRREWADEQAQQRAQDQAANAPMDTQGAGGAGGTPDATAPDAVDHGDGVDFVRVAPADPNHWERERSILDKVKKEGRLDLPIEPEPAGVNEVIIAEDTDLHRAGELKMSKRVNIRPGYDMVRWGCIDEVAFFIYRHAELTPELHTLVSHCVSVLRKVCAVFDYDAYLITLFYQPNTVSRFLEQKLLFNIWQIEKNCNEKGIAVGDVAKDKFIWLYFYGLLVHKLAHFFDVVHGSRHDYIMNETRFEFADHWVDCLEEQGFDPEEIESGEYGWMVKAVVF